MYWEAALKCTEEEKSLWGRGHDGKVRGYVAQMPPQIRQKLHLHVKQFSQKINWKLAETTKGAGKSHTYLGGTEKQKKGDIRTCQWLWEGSMKWGVSTLAVPCSAETLSPPAGWDVWALDSFWVFLTLSASNQGGQRPTLAAATWLHFTARNPCWMRLQGRGAGGGLVIPAWRQVEGLDLGSYC